MSAVAVVVLAIAGIAVMLAPKPSGRPPGTHASQASGVAVTGGCAGDGLTGLVGEGALSSRPAGVPTCRPRSIRRRGRPRTRSPLG